MSKKMKKDYLYCMNKDTCIHKRGCNRWVGNYTDEEAIEEADNNIIGYIDDEDCINLHKMLVRIPPYYMLDRFRLSNGEPMQ